MIDYASGIVKNTVEPGQLKQLLALVGMQQKLQEHIGELEGELKDAKKNYRDVSENAIPTLLDEFGLSSITLQDGRSVTIKDVMIASIPKKNKTAASDWLIEHGLSSLVKNDVVVPFDIGDNDKVSALLELLDSAGHSTYHVDKNINTASVKAAIKELLGQGQEVPLVLFGAHVIRTTIIK